MSAAPAPGAALLAALCAIARDAGTQVMAVYAGAARAWTKEDQTPLTEADLRADAVIRAGLARAFAGTPVLSEESGLTGGTMGRRFFLVDPLDGTREFLQRNGEFTVNIALIEDGAAVAGVVLAPALGECHFAARGLGAWRSTGGATEPIRACRYDSDRPLRIVGSRSHGSAALDELLATLPVPHELRPVGSSLKFCRVAEGTADAYPRFGPTCQWDTAAAQCIVEAAGGCVLDRQGRTLAYGSERPLRNPDFLALGDRSTLRYFGAAEPKNGP